LILLHCKFLNLFLSKSKSERVALYKTKLMNRKKLYSLLALLCIAAALVMYTVGKNSSHLTELYDYFWLPLPLGAIFLLLASRVK
jgi:hypothetical protein